MDKHQQQVTISNASFLIFITLFIPLAIFILLSGDVFINVIYMFCTLALIIITFFFGIVPGLVANIAFIGIQTVTTLYLYFSDGETIRWHLAFWMVLPILLCIATYFMTYSQVQLLELNRKLRASLVERGAFDADTHLRTMVAYVQDATVFIETNRRFKLPVTTVAIKLRFYPELKQMLSTRQMKELLKITSETLRDETRENDIAYLVQRQEPTWGILLYADPEGAQAAIKRVQRHFDRNIAANKLLNDVAINLTFGIAKWQPEKMKTPYDLMNRAVAATQYDVP